MGEKKHNDVKSAIHVYSKTELAKSYNRVRFESPGGRFSNICEKNALLEILCKINAIKVADIACGTGRFSFLMQELGYHVIGIDTSKAMLKVAGNKGSAIFVQASAFSLPFRGRKNRSVRAGQRHIEAEGFFRVGLANVVGRAVTEGIQCQQWIKIIRNPSRLEFCLAL